MSAILPLRRVLDWAVAPIFLLLLFLPAFGFEVTTTKTFTVNAEVQIVTLAWALVVVAAGARALAGRPIWSAGRGTWTRRLAVGLLGWVLLTSAIGFNPGASWGHALTVSAYLLAAQAMLDWMENRPERRTFILTSIFVLMGAQVMICLLQYLKAPMLAWGAQVPVVSWGGQMLPGGYALRDFLIVVGTSARDGTIVGSVGNINYLAELLVLITPVSLLWALQARRRWTRFAALALGAVPVMLLIATGTRAVVLGAIIAGVASAGAAFGWHRLDPRHWWSSPGRRKAVGVVVVLSVLLLAFSGQRLLDKFNHFYDASAESRLINWQATALVWAERPLTGHGLGSYKLLNQPKLAEMFPKGAPEVVSSARFLQAHSEPLQVLAELGLVGLLLGLGLVVCWLRESGRNPTLSMPVRFGLHWGVGALAIASFFGFPLHIPLIGLACLVLAVVGLDGAAPAAQEAAAPLPAGARMAYAAAVLVVLGALGGSAILKGVWPLYLGHRFEYVGEKLKAAKRYPSAETAFALADRHMRFKGEARWQLMQAQVVNGKYDDALALFADSRREGLAIEAYYWKGRAHQLKGEPEAALAAYERVVNFYGDSNVSCKQAKLQMGAIRQQMKGGPPAGRKS